MPDELPIDQSSLVSGLITAGGFSGNGFEIGPVMGRTISERVSNGKCRYDLSPFSSDRIN